MMPWTVKDVDKFHKNLTVAQKKVWVKVANQTLSDCDGDDCEAKAVRIANDAVNKMKKQESYIDAIATLSEAGRMISAANEKKLKDAIEAIKNAMDQLMPLLHDDDEMEEAAKILAQDDSYDARRMLVAAALRKRAMMEMAAKHLEMGHDYYYDYENMPYIRDLYDEQVVYSQNNKLWQCDYKIVDEDVELGDPVEVNVSYVPIVDVEESYKVIGDLVELKEKAVRDDGVVNVKLISPGWGSSGYYSKEVLKRDGPKIFTKGLHMYINHPTKEEEYNRPERDLKDLAGVLEEDAKWLDDGPTGPGLYAMAKVFEPWRNFIDEAAEHIGTSIRAAGRAIDGQAEGRFGKVITGFEEGLSVDYVTIPGRGGEVLPLLEAAKAHSGRRDQIIEEKEPEVTEDEIKALREAAERNAKALQEAQQQIARMQEAAILREARDLVVSTLAGIDLPDMTRQRLAESCSKNPPVKQTDSGNELDRESLVESVKNAATEELKYLASVTTISSTPVNFGERAKVSDEDADKIIAESFKALGWNEKEISVAIGGRN